MAFWMSPHSPVVVLRRMLNAWYSDMTQSHFFCPSMSLCCILATFEYTGAVPPIILAYVTALSIGRVVIVSVLCKLFCAVATPPYTMWLVSGAVTALFANWLYVVG